MNKFKYFFENRSVRGKIIILSGILCILTLILGSISALSLQNLSDRYTELLEESVAQRDKANEVSKQIEATRRGFFQIVVSSEFYDDDEETMEYMQSTRNAVTKSLNLLEEFKQLIDADTDLSADDRKKLEGEYKETKECMDAFNSLLDEFEDACINDDLEAVDEILQEAAALGKDAAGDTSDIVKKCAEMQANEDALVTKYGDNAIKLMTVLIIVVFVFAIITTMVIAKSLSDPLNKLSDASSKLANGDFEVETRSNLTNEIGQLSNNFALMVDTFNGIVDDMNNSFSKMNEGNLGVRIDVSKYNGEYANIAENINEVLDNISEELKTISRGIQLYANGDFKQDCPRFPGEKAIIHESFDHMKAQIGSISDSMTEVIEAVIAGDLEVSVDEENFTGTWKELISKLNQVVVSVKDPIVETQIALGEVTKGNFSISINANKYNGAFKEMLNDIEQTVNVLSSYINEISEILQTMANQNLDVSINHDYVGDFSAIQRALELIITNFNHLIKEIMVSSDQVAIGSQSIADSSTALAQGASEQASAVEELTATIGSVSENTQKNMENIMKSTKLAEDAKGSTERVRNEMDDLLKAMDEINEASNNISNIIKAIDDIAFQTNILALNAAVEAARAGEHGKGFAVVADEVRTLAARSQASARETSEIIQTSLEKVSQGSEIVDRTAATIREITNQIEEISEISSAIAEDSKEQTSSIGEINVGINQIASVVSSNTATSEESAAASEELASQSAVFKETVSKFVLKA